MTACSPSARRSRRSTAAGAGCNRVFVWHEAADVRLFHPPFQEVERSGLVWIGNWGDGERTQELSEFLLEPAEAAGLRLDVHGVRYPAEALRMLDRHGAHYQGWLPNTEVPQALAATSPPCTSPAAST